MGMVDTSIETLLDIVKKSNNNWQKMKAVKMILDCLIVQAKLFKYPKRS